jgi:hypothetical protein
MPTKSPSNSPPIEPRRFVAVHATIVYGARVIARAISKTMAKRIANALNHHTPNQRGE